jgi:hypothetical protein
VPSNRFRTGFVATAEDGAALNFARTGAQRWTVHYQPAREAVRIARSLDHQFSSPAAPILLVEGNGKTDLVVTHPLNTTATSPGFLQPKYDLLRTVSFDGFGLSDPDDDIDDLREQLRNLPSGFVKDPFFGLGLLYDLRFLIDPIEEIDGVIDLRLQRGRTSGLPTVSGTSYVLAAKTFDEARKAINRAHEKALRIAAEEKRAFAHNTLLTAIDPEKYPHTRRPYHKDAILEAVGDSLARSLVLSAADRKAVVSAATSAARSMKRAEREALLELSREIDVVTLEDLLERLKSMIEKKLKEDGWQTFFVNNPFVLRLAFGLPIISIGDQVSVGGRKFSGSGDKISDFAVKAAASGNLALIEIKTPETPLLETRAYRGELYAPARELSGAVNQVLDQRYQLQKSITVLKDASELWEVESYAVQGLVIAGRTPGGRAKLKSFELFRNGLRSVMVITFDELLSKLEHLLEVLRPSTTAPGTDHSPCAESIADRKIE